MALTRTQLAAVDVPGTGTLTAVYTVPADRAVDVNLTIANRADTDTSLRIAHIKGAGVGSVANKDYLLYDLPTSSLADNRAPISYTSILMGAGDTLAVYSSASAVSAQINGIEEDV